MTELRIEKITFPSADFNEVSSLPAISENLRLSFMENTFELGEDDGLFINYGMVDYAFPYKAQDNYSRTLTKKAQPCIVLENDFLKAEFFPQFGGKLHSLFDKINNKNLLFSNSVIRPCHLGVRNAWMSGGVEWNLGYVGHNAFTCDMMHTAITKLDDGTPVLRFYQFERIRGVVYQMDFFLPENSKLLFVRTKIINSSFDVVPMYWWSNIATPDISGSRVIVPAETSYTSRESHPVKIAIPKYNGIDVTYPADNVISIDYFWNIPQKERKFVCQIDKDGYGLIQTSTSRLKGRKLFVWGNSKGGNRWKNFLTADSESGSYNEIQAGLAKTQYECLPMPPNTVWEWVEAYGAISLDPQKAHGLWNDAIYESSYKLNELITEADLEKLLADTKKMAKTPAEKVIFNGDGWGALEKERRRFLKKEIPWDYLDFGKTSLEQEPWLSLLKVGSTGAHSPKNPPISYIYRKEWLALLENAVTEKDKANWFTLFQLGLNFFIEKNYSRAEQMLINSIEASPSPWAYYALAILARDKGNKEKETDFMLQAFSLCPDNISLIKEVLRSLYNNKRFDLLKEVYEKLSKKLKQEPRCMVYYAFALVDCSDIDGAEEILYKDGGIIIPDIRECETITLDLWIAIEKKKAEILGKTFDEKNIDPPTFVDFRMFSNVQWLMGGEILR